MRESSWEVVQAHLGNSRAWPPPQGEWVYEDYLLLPEDDGWQYEVIEGVLYMVPAPNIKHQDVSRNLEFALLNFVTSQRLGRVYDAPVDVLLPGRKTPVQPDLVFVAAARLGIIKVQQIEGAPDLVVEILSPSNWRKDVALKRSLYVQAGVPEYWIVDPMDETVEVYVLGDEGYASLGRWERGETARSQVLAGFEIDVDTIFAAEL